MDRPGGAYRHCYWQRGGVFPVVVKRGYPFQVQPLLAAVFAAGSGGAHPFYLPVGRQIVRKRQ